jgi:hypothetical protein
MSETPFREVATLRAAMNSSIFPHPPFSATFFPFPPAPFKCRRRPSHPGPPLHGKFENLHSLAGRWCVGSFGDAELEDGLGSSPFFPSSLSAFAREKVGGDPVTRFGRGRGAWKLWKREAPASSRDSSHTTQPLTLHGWDMEVSCPRPEKEL